MTIRPKHSSYVLVSLLLMLLAGCQAEHPLDLQPQVAIDPALIGTWRCLPAPAESVDAVASTIVVAAVNRNEYWLTTIDPHDTALSHYRMYPSIVNATALLNVAEVDGDVAPMWQLFGYSLLRPGILLVQSAGPDTIAGQSTSEIRESVGRAMAQPDFYTDYLVCVTAPAEIAQLELPDLTG